MAGGSQDFYVGNTAIFATSKGSGREACQSNLGASRDLDVRAHTKRDERRNVELSTRCRHNAFQARDELGARPF